MRIWKTEARSEEQTGTNWIKSGVRTGPINLVLYSGHASCDNVVFVLTMNCALVTNTPQSQMKFVSSVTSELQVLTSKTQKLSFCGFFRFLVVFFLLLCVYVLCEYVINI